MVNLNYKTKSPTAYCGKKVITQITSHAKIMFCSVSFKQIGL